MSDLQEIATRHRRRAQLAIDAGLCAAAERECRAALGIEPDHGHTLLLLSQALSGQGDMYAGEQAALAAVAVTPRNAFAHYRVGWCRGNQNRPVEAIPALEQAVALAPVKGRYIAALAFHLCEARHPPDRPRGLAERAAQLAPDDEWALNYVALTYALLGDAAACLSAVRAALALSATNADHVFVLAWAHRLAGDFEAARSTARDAVRLAPNGCGCWSELAEALRELGEFDEAERAAREAIRARPEAWEPRLALVRTLRARSDVESAAREAADGIATNPHHPRMQALPDVAAGVPVEIAMCALDAPGNR